SICGGLVLDEFAQSGDWVVTHPASQFVDGNWNSDAYSQANDAWLWVNWSVPAGGETAPTRVSAGCVKGNCTYFGGYTRINTTTSHDDTYTSGAWSFWFKSNSTGGETAVSR
nr:hypothetical protein [Candidatus Sigynarchaeota archaeon]